MCAKRLTVTAAILKPMPEDFASPALSPVDVADWRIRTYDLYHRVRLEQFVTTIHEKEKSE